MLLFPLPTFYSLCSRRNFGLARNLIRRIISPNQDDLSYSNLNPFPGSRNWGSCQTQPFSQNDLVLYSRLPSALQLQQQQHGHNEGTYLIYGSLASISLWPRVPSRKWIRWIQYATHKNNFTSPPKLAMSTAMSNPLRHLALISPLGNIFWRHARFSPKQPRWLQRLFPQTANTTFAIQWRKYLPRTSNNTRCFLHPLLYFTTTLSEGITHTRKNTFLRQKQ